MAYATNSLLDLWGKLFSLELLLLEEEVELVVLVDATDASQDCALLRRSFMVAEFVLLFRCKVIRFTYVDFCEERKVKFK